MSNEMGTYLSNFTRCFEEMPRSIYFTKKCRKTNEFYYFIYTKSCGSSIVKFL